MLHQRTKQLGPWLLSEHMRGLVVPDRKLTRPVTSCTAEKAKLIKTLLIPLMLWPLPTCLQLSAVSLRNLALAMGW